MEVALHYDFGESSGGATTLYFAYTALIAPDRMSQVAPDAEFRFIAHLPETRLIFPLSNGRWKGSLPSVLSQPGNTVWGAVFEIPQRSLPELDAAESEEGRVLTDAFKAVDREGKRHSVLTHTHPDEASVNGTPEPSRDYMRLVVSGGRHWGLPTGWVAGLEEYVEDPLL